MTSDRCEMPVPETALRARLLSRVAASHRHESQFTTVRRDAVPAEREGGVMLRALYSNSLTSSQLVELPPGASVPVRGMWNQCEIVVIAGAIELDGMLLACGDAAILPRARGASTHPAWTAGSGGATLYLRCSSVDTPVERTTVISTLDDAGWDDFCPGVRIRELWNGGERRSVLVRMRPGASVNAHGHALDEECMMLAGEAFIGDTLLRSGEFQLAPRGSRHGAISTDVGALFFVHGSLDPAAYA